METGSEEAGDDRLQWEMEGFRCDVRTGRINQSGLVIGKMMLTREKERQQHKHLRKPARFLPPITLITESRLTQALLETRSLLKGSALHQRALCSVL